MGLILASGSPRRQELLTQMGLTFTVQAPQVDERAVTGLAPGELVATLSRMKAQWVAQRNALEDLVIAADTVVVRDGVVLGKPENRSHAQAMLLSLAGRSHQVYTGVTVCQGTKEVTEYEVTQVHFRPFSSREAALYVQTKEPMDKAGAYGIQGYGALLVTGIQGDYGNVVGLPIRRLGRMLEQFGVDCLACAVAKEAGELS